MQSAKSRILIETVQKLMQTGADANLRRLLQKTHAADLALVFRSLSGSESRSLFGLVDGARASAELVSELDGDIQARLIPHLSPEKSAAILEEMSADEVADLLAVLEEDLANDLLSRLHREDSQEVEDLMGYAADTAGGIMATEFVALAEDVTVEEAVRVLRSSDRVDMAFYVYVVNEYGHLVGVISMRQLVTSGPATPLQALMETNVLRVRPDTDQEEVAGIVARYNYLAVPVVDENNTLIGIVTVDGVIDVIREEATEDILKLAGAGEALEEIRSVRRRVMDRLPSLLIVFLGGLLSVAVLAHHAELLRAHFLLVLGLPLVLGLSATAATQSSSFLIRGLSMGVLGGRWLRRQLHREIRVGAILSIVFSLAGVALGSLIETWQMGILLGTVVFFGMVAGTLVGTLLPLSMTRFRIDPAIATHPLVKMVTHVIALVLGLAAAALGVSLLWRG